MIFDMVVSFAVAVILIAGWMYRERNRARAAEAMYQSAKEAEESGDHELARRRYEAANKIES